MAKVSGIKGINISKASVLNDGNKKTSTNESFRDTANGTTRDNSGNSALDAASLKLLLGQTELLAKKAKEIEQNMQIARRIEEDRQKQLEARARERDKKEAEKAKNDRKREETQSKNNFDSYYNKIDKGIINGTLASFLGPGGVLLGKGLNAMGVPLERLSKWMIRKGGGGLIKSFGRMWGSGEGGKEESENALSVNRREEAAEPIHKLRTSIGKKLDTIIAILLRKKGITEEGKKGKGILGSLKSMFDWLKNSWLGRLFSWLGPKIAYLAGLGALAYGLHKLWNWAKERFGVHAADGTVAGAAQLAKAVGTGVGKGMEKAASSLKMFQKGSLAAKAAGGYAKVLGKLANTGKVGNFLFGKAAANAAKAARAASIARASGSLNGAGKLLLGAGKTISKVGRAAGVVGNLVIAGEAGYDAYQKFKAGDKRGGYGAIGRGTGAIAGGSLGMWGGAAAGAAIGSVVPVIGTAIGGLIGGILGAFGGGWLGSKGGKALGEAGYDLFTGTPKTEGAFTTESPGYNSYLKLQTEELDIQKQLLDSMTKLEMNLNPEIQKDLDDAYINNIKREFGRIPDTPQPDYFNEYPTLNNSWQESIIDRLKLNK